MIGLSAIADKIRLPYPIILIAAGIAIGFIPTLPNIEINAEIIFLIFLPPLLYDAAFHISFEDFKTNINTISTLAITLVFLTAGAIAVAAHYLIPGMTWPLSFVLGSILSATDAVAAMSITKGLGLSKKTNTILEGESLLNDASALVAYRFAVAAVTGTAFVLWEATIEFVILMLGGFLVGFGLGISRFSKQIFPDALKRESKSISDIIIFLLNGLIFILIGLQFPYVIKDIDDHQLLPFIGYALIITVVALLLRMARVFLQQFSLKKNFEHKKRKVSEQALLDFKSSLIISWSGMRGIVSLAIAIGLPMTLKDGSPFPERNTIIFISVVVVLFTLIGQGLTLPWIVKKLGTED